MSAEHPIYWDLNAFGSDITFSEVFTFFPVMPGTLVERGWLTLLLVTFIFILPHLLNLLSLWIFSPSHTWCPCSQLYLRYNIPPFLDCHKRANQIKPNMTYNKAPRKKFKYKFFFKYKSVRRWKGCPSQEKFKVILQTFWSNGSSANSGQPPAMAQLPLLEENKTTWGHLNWFMQNRATPCSYWPKLGSRLPLYTQNSLLCPLSCLLPSSISLRKREK